VNDNGDITAEEPDGGDFTSNKVFLFVLVIPPGLKVLGEGLVCLDRVISVRLSEVVVVAMPSVDPQVFRSRCETNGVVI